MLNCDIRKRPRQPYQLQQDPLSAQLTVQSVKHGAISHLSLHGLCVFLSPSPCTVWFASIRLLTDSGCSMLRRSGERGSWWARLNLTAQQIPTSTYLTISAKASQKIFAFFHMQHAKPCVFKGMCNAFNTKEIPPWGGGLFEVCCAVLLSHYLPNMGSVWWFHCVGIRTPPQVSPQMLSASYSKVFLFHHHLVKHGKTFSHWSTSKGDGFSSSFRFLTCYDSICCSPTHHTDPPAAHLCMSPRSDPKTCFPNLNSFSLGFSLYPICYKWYIC